MSELDSNPRATWASLIEELQPDPQAPDADALIESEAHFHTSFEHICLHYKYPQYSRLLAKFQREHTQILAFVGALHSSLELQTRHSPAACFFTIAYATLQAAFARKKIRLLFDRYIPALNSDLPAFGSELVEFPNDPDVQKPLREAFDTYISAYGMMRDQFCSSFDYDEFLDEAKRVSEVFKTRRAEWEECVKEAKDNRFNAASQPSYPTSSFDHPGNHATRVTFEWLAPLGNGTFGVVSKVRESTTDTIYAQKTIRCDPQLRKRVEEDVRNEVAIMQRLQHHHIATVQFWLRDSMGFSMIMLPVADYDLLRFLREQCIDADFPAHAITDLTQWFGCLISALAFAHSKQVKHEDIKPRNILIKDHQPYLADFGCAKDFSGMESSTSSDMLAFGTPVYSAPENPPRGRAADVFSLGCVFSEMLTVRQKCTLEDYQAYRFKRNRDNGFAFRENLPRVHEWVRNLRRSQDSTGDTIIRATLKMLDHVPSEGGDRPDAKKVKRMLTEPLFCTTCW